MSNLTVGLVGWRGMVGSVLIERMRQEKDFDGITPVFFFRPVTLAATPQALTVSRPAN